MLETAEWSEIQKPVINHPSNSSLHLDKMGLRDPLIGGGNVSRGHHLFGCCDTRRGIFIVKVIDIILIVIAMIVVGILYANKDTSTMDEETIAEINRTYPIVMSIYGATIVIDFVVIAGAAIYGRRLVMFGIVWVIISVVLELVYSTLIAKITSGAVLGIIAEAWPIIWAIVMLYPMIIFIGEVSKGIMTPLTYDREKYCCGCCV